MVNYNIVFLMGWYYLKTTNKKPELSNFELTILIFISLLKSAFQ